MSNKTNQSVLVNDTSSYYLKQYAALQFPGSVDNFGTKTPIHLLQQQEESEHSVSLREACDSDYDLDGAQFLFEGATYDSVTPAVLNSNWTVATALWLKMNFVRMRSVSSTNMTLMLRRSELCCVPTKSVPKNHAHSAVPFSKIKHPASSGATRKTVVC